MHQKRHSYTNTEISTEHVMHSRC